MRTLGLLVMCPDVGSKTPEMRFSRVDLPIPTSRAPLYLGFVIVIGTSISSALYMLDITHVKRDGCTNLIACKEIQVHQCLIEMYRTMTHFCFTVLHFSFCCNLSFVSGSP